MTISGTTLKTGGKFFSDTFCVFVIFSSQNSRFFPKSFFCPDLIPAGTKQNGIKGDETPCEWNHGELLFFGLKIETQRTLFRDGKFPAKGTRKRGRTGTHTR
uniref:Uncharacterized protein n=1 Tax=Cacopsylla melanoneura TaxID=428564 RepID=A0A8D8UAU0_9HEMI